MNCLLGTDIDRAARLLNEGALVAFATETVYGLGGHALDPIAVARIFEAKQRPKFDPLIVHVAERDQITPLTSSFSKLAAQLADAFWPGPLTLVVPKSERVPDLVTSGLPTVALRIPAHPQAHELLKRAKIPVAAPSANPFGRISPTRAEHVAEQLGDKVDYILDGGPCTIGLESTVVLATGDIPVLLRHGGLPLEEIERVVGRVDLPAAHQHPSAMAQPAPGMLPRHYAPRTPLVIADPGVRYATVIERALLPPSYDPHESDGGLIAIPPSIHGTPRPLRVGILSFVDDIASEFDAAGGESQVQIELPFPSGEMVLVTISARVVLSAKSDLREAAVKFFDSLRQLDGLGLDLIVVRRFPDVSLGRALNDRLERAAASFQDH